MEKDEVEKDEVESVLSLDVEKDEVEKEDVDILLDVLELDFFWQHLQFKIVVTVIV